MILPRTSQTGDDSSLFASIANDIANKGYSINPAALPHDLTHLLASHITTMPDANFKRAGIGRSVDHKINDFVRTDAISWINNDSEAGTAWLDWTQALQVFLNRRLFLGLFSFESHFAHYAEGDFYKKHKDAFIGEGNRILSVVVYLNQSWSKDDGGELVIYQNQQSTSAIIDDHTVRVTPGFGTVVVFLSEEFPHEVLAAKRDRFSIAGWFRLNCSIANNIDPPS
ncbi:2OG-Fe(II) oxygenase [Shewanella sp. Choline-02u-19]|uniref:2OG-Fe(II) oxygenase n=1 Tax=unclassified Shewanella TaxID=196818 RepID=UPI000C33C5ED|nr:MULTISPECIES: 2OG-Fe(II) oxygenase [unclassified Shewanella]PKG58552.1 2OG-Fe(II) oxygenase [Shewanella sp. GutDb-MelDb]PKG75987.1 2OG-Fe(II) oxygenase [Shewanella sp. GutCb]PKH56730.1 2OG-Fe(II) oxygenase [Shewanella sp. Bg11-22]PKI30281.1 2OG-Fe(II) oxygenase [Shewanella sp. Choline-02u-19]